MRKPESPHRPQKLTKTPKGPQRPPEMPTMASSLKSALLPPARGHVTVYRYVFLFEKNS